MNADFPLTQNLIKDQYVTQSGNCGEDTLKDAGDGEVFCLKLCYQVLQSQQLIFYG